MCHMALHAESRMVVTRVWWRGRGSAKAGWAVGPTVQLEARKCLMWYINYIFQKPMRFVIFAKCEINICHHLIIFKQIITHMSTCIHTCNKFVDFFCMCLGIEDFITSCLIEEAIIYFSQKRWKYCYPCSTCYLISSDILSPAMLFFNIFLQDGIC